MTTSMITSQKKSHGQLYNAACVRQEAEYVKITALGSCRSLHFDVRNHVLWAWSCFRGYAVLSNDASKSEIRIPRPCRGTNVKFKCSNDKNNRSSKLSSSDKMGHQVWVIGIQVIRYCFEFRISCFEIDESKQRLCTHPYGVPPESPVLWAGILYSHTCHCLFL
jgi:hypothetical protein